MASEFHLRPALIALGIALLVAWVANKRDPRRFRGLVPWIERHARALELLLVGGFFLAATAAKLSQLHSLSLNSEDFWLFEDMLAQMTRGGFFITRFAPQHIGWVQHGAVHPMLSWALALPLAWIVGPKLAAILWGPIVSAGAAVVLGAIARPRWGSLGALAFSAAFLASSQLGKVIMYDVHPESAYPLFVFAWAWAAGFGDRRVRPLPLLLSTLVLMGIKEDSFVVLPSLILAVALLGRIPSRGRAWLAVSGALALAVTAFQFHAVHQWTHSGWGPATWQGKAVILPHGAELMRNRHWDTLSSAVQITREIADSQGGLGGVLGGFLKFLFSRPFLSLLLVAPWAAAQASFWISVLPLLGVYSLLADPGKFINYYSAPILGLFWLGAVGLNPLKIQKRGALIWTLVTSLLLGGGGLYWTQAQSEIHLAANEVRDLIPCLQAKNPGPGMVSGRFLGLVPHSLVWTDRVPWDDLTSVDFYLFSTRLPSFEVPPAETQRLLERLDKDPRWVRLGPGCQPVNGISDSNVLLFAKR